MIKLEVGKSYLDGRGKIVRIAGRVHDFVDTFRCSKGDYYSLHGKDLACDFVPSNLVSEVVPTPAVETRKFNYRDRLARDLLFVIIQECKPYYPEADDVYAVFDLADAFVAEARRRG